MCIEAVLKMNTFLDENLQMDYLMCIQPKTKITRSMTDYVQMKVKSSNDIKPSNYCI